MRAVILARVSTEEQKEAGNSLPAQQARMRGYIDRTERLRLDKEFIFDESAYKEHRKDFQKVIDYVVAQREVVALCCDKVDRLTRDFLVGLPALERLRRDGLIELHFPGDNLVLHRESPATNLFHFNIAVSLAQYYSNAISDNVKRSYEQKRRRGEWTGPAPVGYKNITIDEHGTKDIVFDEEKAPHVRRIFELYATGNYSIKTVRAQITIDGFVTPGGKALATSMIEHILKNPFYHGIARSKRSVYPHKYQPLVTKELWDQCQNILGGWAKKPFKYAGKPYIFRGLLRCARCGCTISPETHKGHVYYACTNAKGTCKKDYVREDELLSPIREILRALDRLPQDKIDDVVEGLRKSHDSKEVYHGNAFAGLRKEYDLLQQRLKNMYMDRLDGRITQSEYDEYVHQFKSRQCEINILLEEHTEADERYYVAASTVLNLARRALEIFESSEVPQKRALLNFMLQNSVVDGKTPLYSLRSPFDTIYVFAKHPTGLPGLDTFRTSDWKAIELEFERLTAAMPALMLCRK